MARCTRNNREPTDSSELISPLSFDRLATKFSAYCHLVFNLLRQNFHATAN